MKSNLLKSIITTVVATIAIGNLLNLDAYAAWIQNTEKKWSYVENDKKATGWKVIDNEWYYFNSSGIMATGWIKDGSTWYYLKSSGAMATGWIKDGSTWYYLKSNGAMATGWIKEGSTWYYLKSSGAMATGWIREESTWYYLNTDGTMATGWLTVNGSKYYLKSSGAMVTGQFTISGVSYKFADSGELITSEDTVNEPSNDKEEKTGYVITKSDPLNLRDGSSTSSNIIGQIPKGSEVTVISAETNGFYKIIWNKKEGYVSSTWISFEKPVEEENDGENEEKDEVVEEIEDGAVKGIRDTAPDTSDKHYFSDSNIFYSAKLSPPFINSAGNPIVGNCTWYAWGRIWELTGLRPIQAGFTGNAYEWWNANIKSGKYEYGTTPKVGSLAVWKPTLANSGGCGHVAIVEKIDNGKIYISESSWHGSLFKFRQIYDVNQLYGYIYIDQPNY